MPYPLMPLRDIVIFPGMVAPLVVGRKKSIQALEDAMERRTPVFLVTQKDGGVDDPRQEHLYTVGTLASVMQLLRLPDGTIKALVEGKQRARIVDFEETGDFYSVQVVEIPDQDGDSSEVIAYARELRRSFEQYTQVNRKIPKEVLSSVNNIEDPSRLVDTVASHLPLKTEEKQAFLETVSLPERISRVLEAIYREMELAELEKTIHAKVKKRMGTTQRNYYLGEKIRAIQEEMGQGDVADDLAELEQAIAEKDLPEAVREKATKELKKLKQMPPMSAETTVVRNYIDTILSLPWSEKSKSEIDIVQAEKILDEDHYGLSKPKERILEYLAVQAQVKKIKGPVICLVGPPGVGKTSVCKSIARAMNRKFIRLSLGGVRDEAEIRGHRRTYIGAMPGKIIHSMQKAGVVNPVFCLDEVDKMSVDFRGDPSAALLEVLDPEQNFAFNDHYLDLDYDLSEVFFITTANNLHGIPLPLQDRMEIIRLSGYTEEEKRNIALGYLIPKQLEANGFKPGDIQFSDNAILEIIRRYTREAGVRNLERTIAAICRKVARDRLKKKTLDKTYRISRQSVIRYLGVPRYRYGLAEEHHEIGLATGMAWTEVGGELLQIEATLMPGSGKLTVTGKLGDVMQESVQAAMSYVRSRAMRLGLEPDFYQKIDIHVHVPEGAIPKDGPSAGITIATSIVSALLKLPVNRQLAMTGEITLRGRVLPIGGLTEKLLAARRGNITHVLIPAENERDLKEVPQKIRNSLTIELVSHVDEVLQKALILKEGEELFQDVSLESIYNDFTVSAHNTPAQ
ncbi:Lon protease [Desulfolithobacter dissulfuricans]|uniref:Lon protease n=1 Tax=Desulfolithobacter dissulfuricans TaxID=2795293 RepID=A0A915U9X0_9BACT|nr:endopeptidase La [Desulfolithobacter dissulfuricans]BCO08810.1 Lon protease [Desulfolithobacter dissulfuricans]